MANWYSGPQGKGSARLVREDKRREAEERNAKTEPSRRRKARRVTPI